MTYEIETVIDLPDSLWDEEVEQYFKSNNLRLVNKSTEFYNEEVCFNYALNDDYLCCCEEAYGDLEEYFKPIKISQAKKGDIISYHEINDFKSKYEMPCAENCMHFAKIIKTNGRLKGTLIRSKWGNDGVFETNLFEVPNHYGNAIKIWRKK